jgi:hypothetical protein
MPTPGPRCQGSGGEDREGRDRRRRPWQALDRDDWIKLLLDQDFTKHDLRFLEAADQLPEDEFLEMARNWLRDSDKRLDRAIIKLVKLLNHRCSEADGEDLG